MKFGEAIKNFFKNYANFAGRARRSEYWLAFLFVALVSAACDVINPGSGDRGSTLGNIWSLACLVPGFAIGVRRLHDTGRSAKQLLWLLLPVVGWIIFLVYMCEDSSAGANQYGDPVK